MNRAPSSVETTSMHPAFTRPEPFVLRSASGLWVELLPHGGVRRLGCGDDVISLFVGQVCESPLHHLWLRVHPQPLAHSEAGAQTPTLQPLLGPGSQGRWVWSSPTRARFEGHNGADLQWQVELHLSDEVPTWFWHVRLHHCGSQTQPLHVELLHVQDVALCSYAAVRLNEYYVSQYIDFTPLPHAQHGPVLAARQNQPVAGRHPWMVVGSLRRATAWSTDALQSHGWAARGAKPPQGLLTGLPGQRLQHEHACIALQDTAWMLQPGDTVAGGFFGSYVPHHEGASGPTDLQVVDAALRHQPSTEPWPARDSAATWEPSWESSWESSWEPCVDSLFVTAPWLATLPLEDSALTDLFGAARAHVEHGPDGALWSFFTPGAAHVVLQAKELAVLRPHGHILRGGTQPTPDETAMTSTVWMGGVFHSMLTQGHVSINRILSTTRSYLGLFRSHGLRLFVMLDGQWQQLGTPSAFEIRPQACRWIYRHARGAFEVCSAAEGDAMTLSVRCLDSGPPLGLRLTAHVALGGDDGCATAPLAYAVHHGDNLEHATEVRLSPPEGSELHQRFGQGFVLFSASPASPFLRVDGDALLYPDGQSRDEPYLCLDAQASPAFALRIRAHLITSISPSAADALPAPASVRTPWRCDVSPLSPAAGQAVLELQDMAPWLEHNAWIHFLAPRGLEQYSGGGWGTRDVCQGPVEMLLAQEHLEPVKDLLRRTFAAQNTDGDWPQWFMFFARDAHIRAGDSHGDIVFWPLLALARYLLASADAEFLEEQVPFHAQGNACRISDHVERALALIDSRCVAGTHLASYWHGDWNDSLQPADPALRERLCSAWTVTLHHQTLTTLAQALDLLGQSQRARALEARAARVAQDFQHHLVVDGVVTGYALFDSDRPHNPDAPMGQDTPGPRPPQLLIHPSDTLTGLKYSLLPMMHAVLEELLEPQQAEQQMALMSQHLWGPDGARLFDAPMVYRGGPQKLFQRAESSTFFGREIGVMYMHAHLRYAEALAHMGHADAFFQALRLAHPIGLCQRLPQARARQSNCYYSSSDAAFADRYDAVSGYARIAQGTVDLEGGWRVYSSGPGIALRLLHCKWLGVECTHRHVLLDPVMPAWLDGMKVDLQACGRAVQVLYRVGASGHGVHTVLLNGQPVAFERQPHRYRLGAAAVPRAAFEALLREQDNRLEVRLGQVTAG